jgi:hypothetical protein
MHADKLEKLCTKHEYILLTCTHSSMTNSWLQSEASETLFHHVQHSQAKGYKDEVFFFKFLGVGWDWVALVRRPLPWPIVPTPDDRWWAWSSNPGRRGGNPATLFFLIAIVRGGVQLGPLGTAATNRPTVPDPGDYDNGESGGMIGKGNRSYSEKTCPSAALSTTKPACCPDANPGRRDGKPATNRLSYGTCRRLAAWAMTRPDIKTYVIHSSLAYWHWAKYVALIWYSCIQTV